MARIPIKSLRYANGLALSTPEELAAHFDAQQVLEFFRLGRLSRWLEDTGRAELKLAVKRIRADASDADVVRQLGAVFGCENVVEEWLATQSEITQSSLPTQSPLGDVLTKTTQEAIQRYAQVELAGAQFEEFLVWPNSQHLSVHEKLAFGSFLSIRAFHANGSVYEYKTRASGRVFGRFTSLLPDDSRVIAISDEGEKAALLTSAGIVRVVNVEFSPHDAREGREIPATRIGVNSVSNAVFGPLPGWLTLKTKDSLIVLEHEAGTVRRCLPLQSPNAVATSLLHARLAVSASVGAGQLQCFSFNEGRMKTCASPALSQCSFRLLVFTPDGLHLIGAKIDGHLECWTSDLRRCVWRVVQPLSRRLRGEHESLYPLTSLSLSSDGSLGLLVGMDGRAMVKFNTANGAILEEAIPKIESLIQSAALGPGGIVFTGHKDGSIRLWNTVSQGNTVLAPEGSGYGNPVTHLVFR